jgi:hypothetical protein
MYAVGDSPCQSAWRVAHEKTESSGELRWRKDTEYQARQAYREELIIEVDDMVGDVGIIAVVIDVFKIL